MGMKCKPVTWREEGELQLLENKVRRKIHEPRKDEVNDKFKTFHSEELHDLYRSP
jgi:hypothetical protein